jgi:pimeloyl-ACP methyl ester carboxylesterase
MIAPTTNAAQAVRFYIYHQSELHPASGATAASIRRGMASFSYTGNNITEQRVRRILAISKTEKYAAAKEWFVKNRMNPAHPSYRKLKAQAWEELAAGDLKVPVLIVWGREDPEGSFDAGVAAYESLKAAGVDVHFRAFDEAGHVPYMEYPEKFNAVLKSFASGKGAGLIDSTDK